MTVCMVKIDTVYMNVINAAKAWVRGRYGRFPPDRQERRFIPSDELRIYDAVMALELADKARTREPPVKARTGEPPVKKPVKKSTRKRSKASP